MAVYPSAATLLARNTHGKPLLVVHRSLRSVLLLFVSFGTATLTVFSIAFLLATAGLPRVPLLEISPRWLSLIPIGIFLEILRQYYNDLYVFEGDRVQRYHGRLSMNYRVPSLRYADIRAIRVRQGLLGRILNFGDIEISTAAQDIAEIAFAGVWAPRSLAALIDDLRAQSEHKSSI